LGPGATNLITAVADAFLDRVPLVVLTGQSGRMKMHKEYHQRLDVLGLLRPITKWNAQANDAEIIPEVVRKAFKLAETEKPGPTHLELPEDVMHEMVDAEPLESSETVHPQSSERDIQRAAEILRQADNPVALVGNGVIRGEATYALRDFAHRSGVPVAETFMGRGALGWDDPLFLGAVGLQARDYELAGFGDADVVVTIGYDVVEHSPDNWNPDRDKTIVCIDSVPAEIDKHYVPAVELVGDITDSLTRLVEEAPRFDHPTPPSRLRDLVRPLFERGREGPDTPLRPPRVLAEIRAALGREDILVSDVGLHKLWIGRIYPAFEPRTVLIANGLAGMGFAVPVAIGAKLVHPERNVLAVCGDGGFLMNCQELETAVRLGTSIVIVVWEDREFGSITWHQRIRFGEHFGTEFGNPDLVKLAESFGMAGWRCESGEELADCLKEAVGLDRPSLITLPIDYSLDIGELEELGDPISPV
jgi:acetolactate synthase I/II/III large subunit